MLFPILNAPPQSSIFVDPVRRIATLRDQAGRLEFRLNFSNGCRIDEAKVLGREVSGKAKGFWSGIQSGGRWYTTADLAHPPKVAKAGNGLQVDDIEYGGNGVRVVESWIFDVRRDSLTWRIDRRYLDGGKLEETAMPSLQCDSMATWDGALLGTGGVAWSKLFDAPNATYGVHTDSATLWNSEADTCLQLSSIDRSAGVKAMRFTREPSNGFSIASSVTHEARRPKYDKSRFQRDRQDVWTGFEVSPNQTISATYELKASRYHETYGRGDFKGLDTPAITELLNTIGRIGVIDENLVGSNGWYSGYICMHEPWLARVGTAIDDPNYVRSCARFLDDARQHAVMPDGMVKSRWKYDAGDAQRGTYDDTSGFYEAQWGRLMDSQSSYVTNVADQFDASGDHAWLVRQKAACESALEYLLRRDADGDALVEMANSHTAQRRSSDWLDIVWASHENAFVNAQLYAALRKWSRIERHLGDKVRAGRYASFAKRLKASFNKPVEEGGFWNPRKGWYVYWRDADGSIHGDNLTLPVNLTAIADSLCDDPRRRQTLLDEIERRMNAEPLLSWPSCFESYAPGEGANDKFPTYENGDVFLAWAEYGVRAYASTQPKIALKYVRQIVDRYKKDGLAFQRYLRADGRGTGDDILANNCNVMTGLYRDLYGIQPKYNRLYLEPHLVPELDGTRVDYNLRGNRLTVDLSTSAYGVRKGNATVRSTHPFGLAFVKDGFDFFPRDQDLPALTIQEDRPGARVVSFGDWTKRKRWTVSGGTRSALLTHRFYGLRAGVRYSVLALGKPVAKVTTQSPTAKIPYRPGKPIVLELGTDSPH